jgi:ribosomal protein S18 acetylase RimI-like enzyme
MEGLTFRPARSKEIDVLSDIVNDPPSQSALNIAGSRERAVAGGRILSRYGISLQIQHTTVAVVDGEPVGLMDAAAGRRDPDVGLALVLRLLLPVVRTVGVGGLWRLLRSRPAFARTSFDPPQGAYYIAELDVLQRFRNRGIGAALLREGEARARAAGCVAMALSTDITNPAQHLYERFGFRVVETKRDAAYERWSGSPGRLMMVKELA